jgi:FkbM family methyltransferase
LAFLVHRRDVIGRHIAKYGAHEPNLTNWIARHLAKPPAGLFVDVGANMGWHTLHAARHAAVETVVAFEPDAFNAWLLDQNLAFNAIDNVVVCSCALGAAPGVATLHRYKASNLGRHSVIADSGSGSKLVPLLDLDRALANLGFGDRRLVLLKIDVEGYEPAVVEGARLALARTDVVILEHSPDLSRAGGLSPAIVVDRLNAHGFASFVLDDDGSLIPFDAGRLETITGQMDVIWMRKK